MQPRSRVLLPIEIDAIPDRVLRDEWRHFAEFGWPEDKIAARLGYDIEHIHTMIRRDRQKREAS